jgi:hypothetical protein
MYEKLEALKALATLLRNSQHSICPHEQAGVAALIDCLVKDMVADEAVDNIVNFVKKSNEIGGGGG